MSLFKYAPSFCPRLVPIVALGCWILASAASLFAQSRFETSPAWPLCGDLYKESAYDAYDAADWMSQQIDCPASRRGADYTDELQVPYGPRHLGSSLTYDWHRGIDIPTRKSSGESALDRRRPIFSIADGQVIVCEKKNPDAGQPNESDLIDCDDPRNVDTDFPDIRLVVEYERPGNAPSTRCAPFGCYYARYTHLSIVRSDLVSPGNGVAVDEGEFLGLTGRPNGSTFSHLHFEIRSSTLNETDTTQRETIHPLEVLRYDDTPTVPCADDPVRACDSSLEVAFEVPSAGGDPLGTNALDLSDPLHPVITVRASLPAASDELDLDRIEVRVSALQVAGGGGFKLVEIAQGTGPWTTMTPENEAWVTDPPYLDIQLFNRQYTYKHEGSPIDYGNGNQDPVLIGDFETGGAHESPFAAGFPSPFTDNRADFHLTATQSGSSSIGVLNGLKIWAARFNSKNSQQILYVQFQNLVGSTDPLCIEAFAYDLQGSRGSVPAASGPCTPAAPASAQLGWIYAGALAEWAPVTQAGFYRIWRYDARKGSASRDVLVYEGSDTSVLLGWPSTGAAFAVEACYASAPSCALAGKNCPTAQCSSLSTFD